MKNWVLFVTMIFFSLQVFSNDSRSQADDIELRRDVYRLILHKEPWILSEHLESASDAFMPFLNDEELMTWDWSVREVLNGLTIEEIQLDQSDRKEVIIQTHARTYCGSGGCNAHILKLDGDEPRYIGTFFYSGTIVKPKIMKNDYLSSRFYDFAVQGSSIDVYRYDSKKGLYRLE